MDDILSVDGETLPLALAIHVDRACLRFEADWKAGGRPCIEAVLPETSRPEHSTLLKELILIDVFYRRLNGQRPLAQDYLGRFPMLEPAWLDGALSSVRGEGSPSAFGDYEGLQEVGRGGMGVVYKAWNRRLRRTEAIKMIVGPASPRDLERFRFEAAAALGHPNIITVYGVGETGGRPFLAMKWLDGSTLSAAMPSHGGDLRTAIGLLAKSARAVHHAHLRGLLHRDLKQDNVLIGADGQPNVADFGLARRLVPSDFGRLSAADGHIRPGVVRLRLDVLGPAHPDWTHSNRPRAASGLAGPMVAADVRRGGDGVHVVVRILRPQILRAARK